MNMKKTIAAIAACAVATSAMATTVAAEEGSLHYNLTHQVNVIKPYTGSVTTTATISAERLTDAAGTNQLYTKADFLQFAFEVNDPSMAKVDDAKWTVTGYMMDKDNVKTDTFSFVDYVSADHTWMENASNWVTGEDWVDGVLKTTVMTIPLDETGINLSEEAVTLYATISVTYNHSDIEWQPSGSAISGKLGYGFIDADAAVDVKTDTAAKNASGDVVDGDDGYDGIGDAYEKAAPSGGSGQVADGFFLDPTKGHVVGSVDTNGADNDGVVTSGNMVSNIYNYYSGWVDGWNPRAVILANVNKGFAAAETELKEYPMQSYINTNTNAGGGDKDSEPYCETVSGDNYWWVDRVDGFKYDDDGKTKIRGNWPTNLMGNITNILAYLGRHDMGLANDKQTSYVNAVPVINDVLANYDDVTFTFNSADGDFGDHLYNYYGDEATGYVYSTAYEWNNLFAGALVVNGQLTMSLQELDVFEYGANTLSFNWGDITGGAVVNNYATYLTKLQLATSTKWHWSSLDISYANTEAEDVTSEAGAEAEEDPIGGEDEAGEDEAGEDPIEDGFDDEPAEDFDDEPAEDADEPAEDADEPAEDADEPADEPADDTPVVENPGTGNAPIALAVVPVALAAAAVVAKKRG